MARRDDDTDSADSANDATPRPQADWLPEAAVQALEMEKQVHENETPEQTARRLMRESSPQIAMGVLHTAMHGSTDRIRLDAQKYVLDRVLGKAGEDAYESNKSPLELLVETLTREAEEFANASADSASDASDAHNNEAHE